MGQRLRGLRRPQCALPCDGHLLWHRHVDVRADDGHHRVTDPLHEFLRQRTRRFHRRGGLRFDRHDHRAGLLLRERVRPTAAHCELQRPLHLRRPVDQPHHEIRHARFAWHDRRMVRRRGGIVERTKRGHANLLGARPPNHRELKHGSPLPSDHLDVLHQRQRAAPPVLLKPRRRRHVGARNLRRTGDLLLGRLVRSPRWQRRRQLLPRQQRLHGRRLLRLPHHQRGHFVDGAPAPDLRNGHCGHLERRGSAGGGRFCRQRPRHVDGPRRHALLVLLTRPRQHMVQRDHDRPAHRFDRHRIPCGRGGRRGHRGLRLRWRRRPRRGDLERLPHLRDGRLQRDALVDHRATERDGRPD